MLLYFAARAQNFDERILPAWERGAVVLSDRFTDSTLAYQGGGRELGPDVVMQLHDIACHGLQPDLTICIDIDTETGWNAHDPATVLREIEWMNRRSNFTAVSVASIWNSPASIPNGLSSSMARARLKKLRSGSGRS